MSLGVTAATTIDRLSLASVLVAENPAEWSHARGGRQSPQGYLNILSIASAPVVITGRSSWR
jgi:hypothetical protein